MKLYKFSIGWVVSLFMLTSLVAENRFFYPEGMEGYPGEDVTIYLMIENDVQLAAYGFSSTFDTSAFKFTLPNIDALTWEGTAAESGNLTMLMASYDSLLGWFGGFAATMVCDPGVSPGEHVAVNIHIHIRDDATPGMYTFGVPYPASPCQMTDCDGHDIEVNEYDGVFQILAVLEIQAPDSIILDEGSTFTTPVTATDIDPEAEVCLWATDLPANATFDSTCATGSVMSTFSFNPDYCQAGSYAITFHAQDEYGRQAQKVVPIIVNNINRPPSMLGGPDQSVMPGDTLTFAVKARDLDYSECGDDTITITAFNLPVNASFHQDSDTTGLFDWPTTHEDTGTYVVTFVAEDRFGVPDTDDVQIVVAERFDSLIVMDIFTCPGADIEVPVYSVNGVPLYNYTFYMWFNPEMLEFIRVDTTGTSSAGAIHFLYAVEPIPQGERLSVMCVFDPTQPMPAGKNLLVNVTFSTVGEVEAYDSTVLHLPPPQWWVYLIDGEVWFVPCFIRADTDCNEQISIEDALYVLRHLFIPESPEPLCMDAADSNDDGMLGISDALYTLRYLFIPGNPQPPAPFPECGYDPTPDDLDCQYHPCWNWPQPLWRSETLFER